MDIIVHYPNSKINTNDLERIVAMVHADLIASYIQTLPYSLDMKCALIQSVCEELHKKREYK
ncbi:MAG: hypothetical protein K0S47_1861 [Herbinix sp.]|jgi:hypothetical protein|nr:hypothetical protein [Herbinix sp.]